MKKGLLFASAVAVSASMFAAAPAAVTTAQVVKKDLVKSSSSLQTRAARVATTPLDVTEATEAIMKYPSNMYYLGMSEDGYTYEYNFGFGSPYMPYTVKSASTGVKSLEWTYYSFDDLLMGEDATASTSSADSITFSMPWVSAPAPTLKVVGPQYNSEIDPSIDKEYPIEILFGADASYINSAGRCMGLTTISRFACSAPEGVGSEFSRGSVLGYDPTDKDTDVNGQWEEVLSEYWLDMDPTATVENVCYSGFGTYVPAPASPYEITSVWAFAYAKFSGATSLELEVIKVEADGSLGETIAKGTCDVTSATTDPLFVFPIVSIDEDGFETEDPVEIDFPVIFAIRNLELDPAVTTLMPLWSTCYDFDASGSNPFSSERYNRNFIKYELNGQEVEDAFMSPWSYYTDDSRKTLMCVTAYTIFCDASFGWCVPKGSQVAVPEIVWGANDGGEEKVFDFETFYSIMPDAVTTDADWLSVEVGQFDNTTGEQSITVMADPLEGEGRTGHITVKSRAARAVTITVTQGTATGAVSTVGADAEVVASKYFDLQGRELKAQPENGLVIRKDIKADGTSTAVKVAL